MLFLFNWNALPKVLCTACFRYTVFFNYALESSRVTIWNRLREGSGAPLLPPPPSAWLMPTQMFSLGWTRPRSMSSVALTSNWQRPGILAFDWLRGRPVHASHWSVSPCFPLLSGYMRNYALHEATFQVWKYGIRTVGRCVDGATKPVLLTFIVPLPYSNYRSPTCSGNRSRLRLPGLKSYHVTLKLGQKFDITEVDEIFLKISKKKIWKYD